MREPWTYMWIGFHGLYAEAMMENTDFSRECPVITCPDPQEICAHMETMLRFNALTYVNELIRMRELYSILVILSREPGENGQSCRPHRRRSRVQRPHDLLRSIPEAQRDEPHGVS